MDSDPFCPLEKRRFWLIFHGHARNMTCILPGLGSWGWCLSWLGPWCSLGVVLLHTKAYAKKPMLQSYLPLNTESWTVPQGGVLSNMFRIPSSSLLPCSGCSQVSFQCRSAMSLGLPDSVWLSVSGRLWRLTWWRCDVTTRESCGFRWWPKIWLIDRSWNHLRGCSCAALKCACSSPT